jgi:Uma2 family endonuclease
MEIETSALPENRITPEEYLEIERAAEFRSEYYDGRMYAMAGASVTHNTIVLNFGAELRGIVRNTSCRPWISELRVRISPEDLYAYPDVVVVCGEPKFADDRRDTLLNPVLIIEVLSGSTEAHDRGFKSTQYRKLDSLHEYALVSQDEPHVELFRRQPGGHEWLMSEDFGLDAVCHFKSLGCQIPFSEIYRDVEFNPAIP